MGSKFRLALIQMAINLSKAENISRATRLVREAAEKGANMVALPEFYLTPCSPSLMVKSAEPLLGEATRALQQAARTSGVYILGGTKMEQDGDKFYNTCLVFDPKGEIVASYRKMHMFDVDLGPDLKIQESEIISPGKRLTTFDTPICRVGLSICYDIRFPELTILYQQRGCKMVYLAGAFNKETGPAHWEAILRMRAVDHQMYIAAVSPARDPNAPYQCWGHSMIVNPWGDILAQAGFEEETVMADIDMEVLERTRRRLPLTEQRRPDVYRVEDLQTDQ